MADDPSVTPPPADEPTGKDLRTHFESQLADLKAKDADRDKEIQEMRRERAFEKAGIPDGDGPAKLFREKYDGDLDPTKVKEAAEAYGIVKAATATPPEDADAIGRMLEEARAEGGRRDSASAGVQVEIDKINAPEFTGPEGSDLLEKHLRQTGIMPRSE